MKPRRSPPVIGLFCRRAAAEAFRAAWAKGNGGLKPRASEMDETLHRERFDGGQKRLHALPAPVAALPDGAMVAVGDAAYLIAGGKALPWSPSGYGGEVRPLAGTRLLTPPATVRALAAGYAAILHPTVDRGAGAMP